MGLSYGQSGYAINSSNISVINLTNCTLASIGDEGSYSRWSFSMQNVACGSTGFNLIINDSTIPFVWTKIAWKTRIQFGSACWAFGHTNGAYGTGNHNILSWDPALGDSISKPKNCWELPQYTLKMNACDNNSDNFTHPSFMTGTYREWNMKRRRNGTNTAGANAGFACTSGGLCVISQIMVFR